MSKKLELPACTALVVGNMIGSGVFLLPASLAPYGGWSLLGWLMTTAGSLCLALLFAWLSAALPRAGGLYAYTRAAFGPFAGFLVAWGYWLSIVAGNAAIAVALVGYLTMFWPALDTVRVLAAGAALLAIGLLTLVNCRGVRTASHSRRSIHRPRDRLGGFDRGGGPGERSRGGPQENALVGVGPGGRLGAYGWGDQDALR
jgi:APA family basic amino acid/polyamine antiporter